MEEKNAPFSLRGLLCSEACAVVLVNTPGAILLEVNRLFSVV